MVEVTQEHISWATSIAQHLCHPADRDAAIRLVSDGLARFEQEVLARASTAPDAEPVGMNRIVLQMEAASKRDAMWERRWQALRALNYHNTNFVDSNGRWSLADFISYAGEVCGYHTHPAEPVDDRQRATNPVDAHETGDMSDNDAVVQALRKIAKLEGIGGPDAELKCANIAATALAAMGERS